MALEQNLQEPTAQYECDGDISLKQKWKSISASAPSVETADSCFDCNICLDSAHDPVVTLCGHLFCWPCIYKWLHVQNSAPDADHQQKCPVCKTDVSSDSLVPLYGRGNPSSRVKRPNLGLVVPRRPKASGLHTLVTSSTTTTSGNTNPHFAHPYGGHSTPGSPTLGGMAMPNVLSPTAGMFGGMVYARIFGSPDSSLFTYPYPNPYGITGSSSVSPRMRRRELQADKSLSRVSLFLFCCFVLCLLLF